MIYNVDVDGILCECTHHEDFNKAKPKKQNIDVINELYKSGNYIRIYTSRKLEDKEVTKNWLHKNNVYYHEILMDKPIANFYIDDCAINNVPYIREKNEPDTIVICVSGGLDSTIAYFYAKEKYPDISIRCIFFNIGQPYAEKEKNALNKIGIDFIEIELPFYKNIEYDKHIIPNRNSIFANIAALYGNKIWIVGLKYENHYLMFDKNAQFYQYISLSLSQSMGKEIIVETPFKDWSKTDILKYSIKRGLTDVVDKTTSCYHPTKHRCGNCSLCVRRYVAGRASGYNEVFTNNPKVSDEAKDLVLRYEKALLDEDFSHYSRERIIESLKYLK